MNYPILGIYFLYNNLIFNYLISLFLKDKIKQINI